MAADICIVSPGNLGSNPRILKEADALHEAGHRVTTIACDYTESFRAYDDEIARSVAWKVVRVKRPALERLREIAARAAGRMIDAIGIGVPLGIAATASGGPVSTLRAAALAQPADLYIAHYTAALPAAAAAAGRHGGLLGFDAEDFHPGEGQGTAADDLRLEMVQRVEESLIPPCRHLTAASPLIGRAYAAQYGMLPSTVLNVFPLAMAPAALSPQASPPGTLRAYWFSQTIGLDRGLQSFLEAMARSRTRVSLDIRGSNRWGHGDTLLAMARDLGIADRVTILPLAPPGEMVRLAASYDLGLSLETEATQSRKLCLTNKIFTYLLAGIPVMLSDTPAQREFAPQLASAASLVALADPQAMALSLDRLASPGTLAGAKATAWRLARERFNWDFEKRAFLAAVASALASATDALATRRAPG